MEPAYVYRATCKRVVDGDTFVGQIDLGFGAFIEIKVRLHGVNAPEHNQPGGPEATAFLQSLIGPSRYATGAPLLLKSYKDARSFERWVCDVWVDTHVDWELVADTIIATGHGVTYDAR